jgi:hypothetical protein
VVPWRRWSLFGFTKLPHDIHSLLQEAEDFNFLVLDSIAYQVLGMFHRNSVHLSGIFAVSQVVKSHSAFKFSGASEVGILCDERERNIDQLKVASYLCWRSDRLRYHRFPAEFHFAAWQDVFRVPPWRSSST